MDADKKIVSIGLDINAQDFARALEEEAIASYQAGYEAHKAERRAANIKVLKQVGAWAGAMLFGFLMMLLFAWASR